jgi:putative Mg2+ transporter-C (MgtC) family protein
MNEDLTFIGDLLLAMFLGSLIGFERQWHQRTAGLRTNALVCTGAFLFTCFSKVAEASDELRVAAQVVSGIGFLGAGVIMREGSSVRGLNTAATLWCSGSIGTLTGFGYRKWAFMGTLAILVCNILLRPLAMKLYRQDGETETEFLYLIRIACEPNVDEIWVRTLLLQAISTSKLILKTLESGRRLSDRPGVEVRAELFSNSKSDSIVEQVVNRLSVEKGVDSISWRVEREENVWEK